MVIIVVIAHISVMTVTTHNVPHVSKCFRQVAYSRRELHGTTTLLGLVANQVLSKALKMGIRQKRPGRCELLGICHEYGMPSAHTQVRTLKVPFIIIMMIITRFQSED
jgi:hypothetical protein